MTIYQIAELCGVVFFPSALGASVGGLLLFAMRAFRQRDEARSECRRLDARNREAVSRRLEAQETASVWRGAAGLANDRARQADESVRALSRVVEEKSELVGALKEMMVTDAIDMPEPPPRPPGKPEFN